MVKLWRNDVAALFSKLMGPSTVSKAGEMPMSTYYHVTGLFFHYSLGCITVILAAVFHLIDGLIEKISQTKQR